MANLKGANPAPAKPAAPAPPPASSRKKAQYEKNVEAETCKVTLPTGESFGFSVHRVAPSLIRRLAFHGLVQKVMDAAAGEKGQTAIDSMRAAFDQLVRGVWTERVKVDPAVRRARIADAIVTVFAKAYADKHAGKTLTQAIALAYPSKTFNKLSRDPRVQQALGKALADPASVL